MYSIKKAAKILGVTPQTLRNWDKSGYLKPSKTEGGHRRYSEENLNPNLITTCECDCDIKIYNKLKEKYSKHPLARQVGGFSKEEVGILLTNQETINQSSNIEKFFSILEMFSSPYFFTTNIMFHPVSLVYYHRIRDYNLVIESETIVSSSYKAKLNYNNNDEIQNLIDDIEKSFIENIINNAGFVIKGNEKSIKEAILKIEEKTKVTGDKFVIFPPELKDCKNTIKLNKNTRKVIDSEVYISRLIPDNRIIVGTKNNKYLGYCFCPYQLDCFDERKNEFIIRIGSKLCREGSGFYAVIDIS